MKTRERGWEDMLPGGDQGRGGPLLTLAVLSRPARRIAVETAQQAELAGPECPAGQALCAAPAGPASLSLSFSCSNASQCAHTAEISR